MIYVVDTDINKYGYLYESDDSVSARAVVEHRWTEPLPVITEELEFLWGKGSSRKMPNVLCHNQLSDFVCDADTYDFLQGLAGPSLRLVARGLLDQRPMFVLQAVAICDVVDQEMSIRSKFEWGGLDYPHVPADLESVAQGKFFRAPNPGLERTVMMAGDVKEAIEGRGIRGFRFETATVEQD